MSSEKIALNDVPTKESENDIEGIKIVKRPFRYFLTTPRIVTVGVLVNFYYILISTFPKNNKLLFYITCNPVH